MLRAQPCRLGNITPAKPVFSSAALLKTRFNGKGKCRGSGRLHCSRTRNKGSRLCPSKDGRISENKKHLFCAPLTRSRTQSFDGSLSQSSLFKRQVYGNCDAPISTLQERESEQTRCVTFKRKVASSVLIVSGSWFMTRHDASEAFLNPLCGIFS